MKKTNMFWQGIQTSTTLWQGISKRLPPTRWWQGMMKRLPPCGKGSQNVYHPVERDPKTSTTFQESYCTCRIGANAHAQIFSRVHIF